MPGQDGRASPPGGSGGTKPPPTPSKPSMPSTPTPSTPTTPSTPPPPSKTPTSKPTPSTPTPKPPSAPPSPPKPPAPKLPSAPPSPPKPPAPPSTPPTPPLPPHEAALLVRIRDFDPAALLDVLAHLGYQREHIRFRGHYVHGPQPTLFHDIAFAGDPRPAEREVTVTVNLGLLSGRSSLPSYFDRLIETIETEKLMEEPFVALLRALDQGLIAARLRGFYPERDQKLFPDPWAVRHDLLRLTSLRSPVTLDWLFRRVYPELGVLVHRTLTERFIPGPWARLGSNRIGEAVLGDEAQAGVQGLTVVLMAAEPEAWSGIPWPREARRRLEDLVFPLLGEIGLTLSIVLVLARGHAAQFDRQSYVGYDPLGSEAGPHRLLLFSGRIP